MKEPRTIVVYGGPSVRVGRIVCIKQTEPPETMCPNTSRPDRPSLKSELSKPGGMSDLTRRTVHKLVQPKPNTSADQTPRAQEHDEFQATQTVHAPHMDHQSSSQSMNKNMKTQVNSPYPSIDLPNDCMDWEKILGKGEASLGDSIPKNLEPQTTKSLGIDNEPSSYEKLGFQPKIYESEAKSGVWGVKIKHN
jgi:hypothetical protein